MEVVIPTRPHFVTIVDRESNTDHPSLDAIENALRIRGIDVTNYAAENLIVSTDGDLPVLMHRGEPVDLDAAIVSSLDDSLYSLVAALEAAGVPILNSLHSIFAATHKGNTNSLLSSRDGLSVPLARSFTVRSVEAGVRAAEKLGFPVVVKRAQGAGGEYVRKATDSSDARVVLSELEADVCETIISQYVECNGRARRIVVIGGVAIPVATEHTAPRGEFRTQRVWGGTVAAVVPTEAECALAETIAARSGHGYMGIDIGLVSDDLPHDAPALTDAIASSHRVVFEINSQPELVNLSRSTGYDFPGAVADYLIAKARHCKTGGQGHPIGWAPAPIDASSPWGRAAS